MAARDESWLVHLDELGPGTLIDSWRVVERLGAGGYGAVYKVEHVAQPGDCYALKLALHRRDKRTVREELLLMGKAVHPNVVCLHASGRWPHPVHGNPYFVMSWVDGLALDTWAETVNPSFRQLAETAGKVALALGALHERGVLHRDLKPAHVILRYSDGEPILIDLGVGSFEGADTLTYSVLPPATPHLLSPEAVTFLRKHHQQAGARYETKPTDDLHALGVLLYRLVTGHYPYSPKLPLDLLYAAIETAVPPEPVAFNPRVPRALSDLLMRLLAKNPRERPQSGRELHAALAAAVSSGPEAAWEASLFEWEEAPQAGQASGAVQRRVRLPEWPTEPMAPPPRKPVSRPVWPYLVFLGLTVASFSTVWGAKALGLWPLAPEARQPAGSAGRKVAQQVVSPETSSTAAPPPAVPTPAVVAVPATPTKDEAPVKKKPAAPPSSPTSKNKPRALGSVAKAICVGATSAALGCAGAPVRPKLPPEECPPGSEEGMKTLGLRIGSPLNANFSFEAVENSDVPVSDGKVEVCFHAKKRGLPYPIALYGELFVGEKRVYGRFTRARARNGTIDVPVCFELMDTDLVTKGRPIKGDRNAPKVYSSIAMRAVDKFE